VLCDLNNLKAVNGPFRHAFGDDILRQFGFRLRLSFRQGDTAARIAATEFAVILIQAEGHESAGFIERLRAQLESPTWASSSTSESPRLLVTPPTPRTISIADARPTRRRV